MRECNKVNEDLNLNLMNRLCETFSYTEYNKAILSSSEETAMIENSENQGWLHFSRDTLTPTLDTELNNS